MEHVGTTPVDFTEIAKLRREVDLGKSMYARALLVFCEDRDRYLAVIKAADDLREVVDVLAVHQNCEYCERVKRYDDARKAVGRWPDANIGTAGLMDLIR